MSSPDSLAFAEGIGLGTIGLTYSPITGPEGNIEFLVYWKRGRSPSAEALESGADGWWKLPMPTSTKGRRGRNWQQGQGILRHGGKK